MSPRPILADPLDIMRLAQSGRTAKEAAQITGAALYTVQDVARDMGVTFRDPRTPDPDTVDRMLARRRQGATYAQIGAEFGYGLTGARKIILRAEGAA